MALLEGLLAASAVFLGVQGLTLLSNLVFFPVLTRSRYQGEERVSILVPARNEETNLREGLPRVLKQGAFEVIVLNDGSTDGTAGVLEDFRVQHPSLRVLAGEPLPEGWNGKNWACWQLAGAAKGEILIFTDADVLWEEGTLEALLSLRERSRAGYVSVWPRQVTVTLMERLTVPLIDVLLLSGLPYLGARYLRPPSLSAGNGQLMLFTKEAYWRTGGHERVKSEVLEDVKLGQRAKAAGNKVALAVGGSMLSTRMYRSHDEVVAGFSKNYLAAHLNSRWALRLSLLMNTLTYTLSFGLALVNPLWLLIGLGGMLQRALTCLKTRRNPLEAFLQPLMVYPLWRIGLSALRQRGSYEWKGRRYEA